MRIMTVALLSVLIGSGTQAATNYFTAAVNNQTQNAGNWSGSLQDWDDAVIANWTSFKESATAWANMKYNTLTFNNEIIGGTQPQFVFNTSATTITNFFRDQVTVNADVTKNVRLGGSMADDDGTLDLINNSTTARFEAYSGIHSAGGLTLTYTGAAGAKFQLGGGAVNSTYAGSTILDGITADVIVNGSAAKGPFGVATNRVFMKNGATIEINEAGRTLKNDVIVEAGETGTITSGNAQHTFGLDVDGELTVKFGTRWLNGTISGTGTVNQVGGTLVMNNTAMDSDFSGTMTFAAVSQARSSDQFGTAKLVLLTGANFRGFNDQAGETISIPNELEVSATAAADIVRIASAGAANTAPHTVVSNITFAANGNLALQATANGTSASDTAVVDVLGVISDGAKTGSVIIDNEWTGTSFPNGVVKLYGVNTYTGTTTVEDGRVQLIGDASIDDSSEIIMMSAGILDLTTRTGGTYTYGGIFGGSGTVEGDLTLTNALRLAFGGTGAGEYDVIDGSGDLVLGDTVYFDDNGLTTNDIGTAFTVLTGWTSISGTPTNFVSESGCTWSFDAATGVATLLDAPPPPPTVTDLVWTFNTDGDTEGWFDGNEQSTGMTTTGGVLTIDGTTGIDPYLQLDAICDPQGESWYQAEVRMRQLDTNGVPMAWTASGCSAVIDHLLGDDGWTILGAIGQSPWITETEASGEWITASYDLRSFGTNAFIGLRFDAIGGTAPVGSSYEVDYIRLTKGEVNTISTPVDTWEFNTAGDVEGWTVNAGVSGHTAADGYMICSATSGDPQWFYTGGVTKTSGLWDRIECRVRQLDGGTPVTWSGGGTVSVISGVANITPFLSTTDRCTVAPDGDNWYILDLDISECSLDTIGNIRLDFLPAPRTVEVDWIRIYSKEEGLVGYNGWAYGYNDLDDVAPNADPDGDGNDNFAEYACGGDPSDPASGPIGPSLREVGGQLEYVYGKRTDDTGLTYSLQGTLDLTAGWNNWVKDVDYTEAGSGSAGDNMTAVTNLIPMGVDAKFVRIKAEE